MSKQLDLFTETDDGGAIHDYLDVPGLVFHPNFLTQSEQDDALKNVYGLPWQDDLKRRVQHYGYKYDYRARKIDATMYVGPLPEFAQRIGERLVEGKLMTETPDQLIVNEYLPGQGITAHVDCEPCFTDQIVTISLGSEYEMEFSYIETSDVKKVRLRLGSAILMQGDARYKWKHAIKARKSDNGVPRGTRVSLTYRKVILETDNLDKLTSD